MHMKHSNEFSVGLVHNLFWFSSDMAQFPSSSVQWSVTFLKKKKIFEAVTSAQCSAGVWAQRLGEDAQISLNRQFPSFPHPFHHR